MKQTLEEAAIEYQGGYPTCEGESVTGAFSNGMHYQSYKSFIAGAEWKAKQSPWTLISDRSNPMPNDKPCLLLLEDGSVVDDSSDWEERYLMVVAWMLKPSFDQILEANKDVLQRLKEKGD